MSAGIRYLVAFGTAWIGVGIVGRLFNNYLADIEVAGEQDDGDEAQDGGSVEDRRRRVPESVPATASAPDEDDQLPEQ